MMQNLWLKLNNRMVASAGIIGIGLLPCPDCGLPLAVKVWPVAGVFWVWRRFRRHSAERLTLLLSDDLRAQAESAPPASDPAPDHAPAPLA